MIATIGSVIDQCDRINKNRYQQADKIAWLSALDAKISDDLLMRHVVPGQTAFKGYDENTPLDTMLLVQGPQSDIYAKWLVCNIHLNNAETTRYNNAMAVYNFAWADLAGWVNRTYMPTQPAIIDKLI